MHALFLVVHNCTGVSHWRLPCLGFMFALGGGLPVSFLLWSAACYA